MVINRGTSFFQVTVAVLARLGHAEICNDGLGQKCASQALDMQGAAMLQRSSELTASKMASEKISEEDTPGRGLVPEPESEPEPLALVDGHSAFNSSDWNQDLLEMPQEGMQISTGNARSDSDKWWGRRRGDPTYCCVPVYLNVLVPPCPVCDCLWPETNPWMNGCRDSCPMKCDGTAPPPPAPPHSPIYQGCCYNGVDNMKPECKCAEEDILPFPLPGKFCNVAIGASYCLGPDEFRWDWTTVTSAVDSLEDFMTCIMDLEQPRYQIGGAFNHLLNMTRQPLQAGTMTYNVYLQPLFDGLKTTIENNKDVVMAIIPTIDLKDNSWIESAIDAMFVVIEDLVNQPGYEPAKCGFDLAKPAYEALKPFIKSTLEDIITTIDAHREAFETSNEFVLSMANKLEPFFRTDTTKRLNNLKAKAVSNANVRCMEHVSDGMNSSIARGDRIEALRKDDAIEFFGFVTAQAVGQELNELMRDILDEYVSPVVQMSVLGIESVINDVLFTVEGVCGLIPEVGAALCAPFTSAIGKAKDWIANAAVVAAMTGLRMVVTKMVGEVSDWIQKNVVNEINGLEDFVYENFEFITPAFEPLFNYLKSLIEPLMPEVEKARTKCKQIKKDLADLL